MKKAVTFTIPEELDALLHARVGRGKMSRYVTQILWKALELDDNSLLMEFLESDKDPGYREAKKDFFDIEGEDFIGIEDFDTNFGKEKNEK